MSRAKGVKEWAIRYKNIETICTEPQGSLEIYGRKQDAKRNCWTDDEEVIRVLITEVKNDPK